ncbi:hypothetical protein PoB_005750100 [Plakobranchus ocellatus]|uniref:Uncharacterized protein n=1 Tax=Plakobranchus ocellatus TaxID=259542 RepID=A0AAV4CE18_9GAST|nr:hypothetical protein PoB_005750100 [Plakobranchus ocellatus]
MWVQKPRGELVTVELQSRYLNSSRTRKDTKEHGGTKNSERRWPRKTSDNMKNPTQVHEDLVGVLRKKTIPSMLASKVPKMTKLRRFSD